MTNGNDRIKLEELLIEKAGLSEDFTKLMSIAKDEDNSKLVRGASLNALYTYVVRVEKEYQKPLIEVRRIINLYERQMK